MNKRLCFLVFITSLVVGSTTLTPSYATQPGSWEQLHNVAIPNPGIMFLLTNGSVLIQDQGQNNSGSENWWILTPDSHGSYVDGSWKQTGSTPSNYKPMYAASSVLPDGRVLVLGGELNGSSDWVGLNTGEIYDPSTGSWSAITPPNNGQGEFSSIADAPSTLLADGRFMFGPSGNGNGGAVNQKQQAILNANDLTWTVTGNGMKGANPEAGYTLLPNDKVLMIDTPIADGGVAEIFDPVTGIWSPTGPMPTSLLDLTTAGNSPIAEIGPAIVMPNGKVFAEGSNKNTAIYDPATNSWSAGPVLPADGSLQMAAADAASAILPSGNVLIDVSPVGNGEMKPPAHFYLFDGATYTNVGTPPENYPAQASNGGYFLALPNGQILFCERMGSGSLFVYKDSSPQNMKYAPIIDSVPNKLMPSNTYQISGKQLSGLTQGSEFGDDWNNQTNYPLVQITNKATGEISYANTFNASSLAIRPGVAATASFTIPANISQGESELRVIASGFASAPVTVMVGDVQPTITTNSVTANTTSGDGNTNTKATNMTTNSNSTKNITAIKQVSINCYKGKAIKRINGTKPTCPTGYILKK